MPLRVHKIAYAPFLDLPEVDINFDKNRASRFGGGELKHCDTRNLYIRR